MSISAAILTKKAEEIQKAKRNGEDYFSIERKTEREMSRGPKKEEDLIEPIKLMKIDEEKMRKSK